jgi:hypothetical protein
MAGNRPAARGFLQRDCIERTERCTFMIEGNVPHMSGPESTVSHTMALATASAGNGHVQLRHTDSQHLHELERQLDVIRDRVTGVALGYHNGLYLVGRPGTGKTRTVCDHLRKLKVPFVFRNSRMTSQGLYQHLSEHPEGVSVLDDISTLWQERPAQQILLAAMNGEPGDDRVITYTTAEVDGRKSFTYKGSIIGISNLPLRRDPVADALQSRTTILEHNPTDDMLAALGRAAAAKGWQDLKPAEASEVVEFVIAAARTNEYRLDLRSVTKGFEDYRLWRDQQLRTHWHDLITSSMKRLIGSGVTPLRQADKRLWYLDVARQLSAKFPGRRQKAERDAEWSRVTGLSPDQLYRYAKGTAP